MDSHKHQIGRDAFQGSPASEALLASKLALLNESRARVQDEGIVWAKDMLEEERLVLSNSLLALPHIVGSKRATEIMIQQVKKPASVNRYYGCDVSRFFLDRDSDSISLPITVSYVFRAKDLEEDVLKEINEKLDRPLQKHSQLNFVFEMNLVKEGVPETYKQSMEDMIKAGLFPAEITDKPLHNFAALKALRNEGHLGEDHEPTLGDLIKRPDLRDLSVGNGPLLKEVITSELLARRFAKDVGLSSPGKTFDFDQEELTSLLEDGLDPLSERPARLHVIPGRSGGVELKCVNLMPLFGRFSYERGIKAVVTQESSLALEAARKEERAMREKIWKGRGL